MLPVLLGVMLAGLAGMVCGMRGVAVGRMGVMARLFVMVRLMMLGGLAMMPGSVLVVLGRGAMMLDDLVFGHVILLGQISGGPEFRGPARAPD